MRNEVKLGLAVGGVLLAVLIVYVLVVPGSAEHGGAEVALEGGPGDVVAPESIDAPVADYAADAPAGDDDAAGDDAPVTVAQDAPAQQRPAVTQTPTGAAAEGTDPFAQQSMASAGTPGGDYDWQKLLYPDGGPPELMNDTTVSTGTGSAEAMATEVAEAPQAPVADAPVTAAAPEPTETADVAEPVRSNAPSDLMATVEARTLAGPNRTTPPAATDSNPVAAGSSVGTTPSPSAMRTHKIQSGETLSSIASVAYGSPSYYPHIIRANPGIDPNRLRPGTTINLPDASQVKPAGAEVSTGSSTSSATATIDPNKQYRVQPGDSLERISTKLYGTRDRLEKIYDLNRNTIGADPARIKVGQVLNLPETPTVTTTVSR